MTKEGCPLGYDISSHFDREGFSMVRNRGFDCYAKALGLDSSSLKEVLAGGNGMVLDLGCGEGRFIREAGNLLPDCYFWGIDASLEEEEGRNWRKTKAFFESFCLEDGPVDTIISVLSFPYYASNQGEVVKQIKNVSSCLKTGGYLYVVTFPRVDEITPCLSWLHADDTSCNEVNYDKLAVESTEIYLRPISSFGSPTNKETFPLALALFEEEELFITGITRSFDTESTLGAVAIKFKKK